MTAPVELVVYSDYLCPWCFNASVTLERLREELGPEVVSLEWRSYLLRPEPPASGRPGLEKFRLYTRSWLRPAAEPDAGEFRVWEGDTPPPTHSIPAHLVAKAARTLGEPEFRALHHALLRGYFAENRDVSDRAVLAELWREAGLPVAELARADDPALLARTLAEHEEALALGTGGVPAVRVAGTDLFVTGALPRASYRRWVERLRSGAITGSGT